MKVVRFLKTYRMYQPGERAGFAKAEADALIAQGFAVDPDAVPIEDQDPAPKDETDQEPALSARDEIIAAVIAELGDSDFTQSGKPEVDAINALMLEGVPEGMQREPVTAAERDAVWSLMQVSGDVSA
ncbi:MULTISPECIES: hypothetical protein [unclassified Marinovum]|uniref:hypothetical protein n=1 Tax=unclassified Marinovum TaxID=2647166 RepID=UPI003EDC0C8B